MINVDGYRKKIETGRLHAASVALGVGAGLGRGGGERR